MHYKDTIMPAENKLERLRHSAAHLLAHAIIELFPNTKLTIGPATRDGFFYDFLPATNLKESDLPRIEEKMHVIANRNLAITHKQITKNEAKKLYQDNPFKLELINGIEGETVGLATQGNFHDLCRGGHVEQTGLIKYFKLTGISGAYWRANPNNPALQRISGTAFFSAKDLRSYEKQREQALKYDHRKVGRHLDFFSFHDYGVGFPFFHPKGTTVMRILKNYLRKLLTKAGYQEIQTPLMLNDQLWKQSGHYAHYKNYMYFCTVEEKSYAIKPMNCPGSILIYKERPHSYRELPIRLSEFGQVHRYELSGVLHGLFRARAFTIDDGHIYCTPEQIEDEVLTTITMTKTVFQQFNFETIHIKLATKPSDAMGSEALWKKATTSLENALKRSGIPYEIAEGEGAFYGPKIEFHIQDSMKRSWQCGTIQIDFFQAENFNLTYVTHENKKARPVIIHRAIYGSFERFFGILLEHYQGKLPFWIAPVQAKILTITDEQKSYAYDIAQMLQSKNVRAYVDESSNPIAGQIKAAQSEAIPWMIIIGNKEAENKTVTLRYLNGKQEHNLDHDLLLKKVEKSRKFKTT
jgi:threonyl-tRNA synthetase